MRNNRFIIKPWLIVSLVLIIPTLLFTSIEILTLNDQEEVIESIYTDQLESVLFSINQYADDICNNWINEIYKDFKPSNYHTTFVDTSITNPQIQAFILHPIDSTSLKLKDFKLEQKQLKDEIITQLNKNSKEINLLKRYIKTGYRKIIGIDLDYTNHATMLVFLSEDNGKTFLNILLVDASQFISRALSPRLQMVAGDDLIIVVRHSKNNELIACSLLNSAPDEVVKEQAIWLLPDYNLGIQPKGISISQLAKKRAQQNIGLLILVDLLLIGGAWLFYRNVKRELHLAKVKSDFVSNVSHEIRTPLALISMYAETLQLGRLKDESKRHKYYDIIYRETQRLSGIVNNILNFSRIESGRQKITFEDVHLNDIVESVLNNYQYHLKEKGFILKVNLNDQLSSIKADNQAITESLINLIDNAIKYSDKTKEVTVSTGLKNTFQYIEVSDKGIGISPKERKHIFDKFYRVTKGALAHCAKGSGLGLSIVMHLIKEHKGHIELDSSIDKGSSFRLLLPTQKSEK